MEIGKKIMFLFGGKGKEGKVVKIFPKTVYIVTDFENHKGKIIKRKLSQFTEKKMKKK